MKQLLSIACLGVLCLLLSSNQAYAQVSRKGGDDQPKVILKKDKNETTTNKDAETETQRNPTRTETTREKAPTTSRRKAGTRTFPDRREDTTTDRQEQSTRRGERLPETESRYPYPRTKDRYPTENRRTDRRDGDYEKHERTSGDYRGAHDRHDESCDHPGKGRHLGWHKQKNKQKNKKGKGKGGKH